MITHVSGTGRPLVAIPGFGLDHHVMLPLEDMVGDEPWRRLYFDLPWTAGAGWPDVRSTQGVADGVVAEVRVALGAEPFAIIGHSFGGMIARFVAHELRDQVLGLATIAGVVEADHARRVVPPRQVLRSDPGIVESAGQARTEFEEDSVIQTAETLAAFEAFVLPGLRNADQSVLDRIAADYALRIEPEVAHPLPFGAPSLHLFGRQDDVVGYEDGWALRDHYPRGTYAVLDAAGHGVHLEQRAITAALVRDWLDRMAAAVE